MNFNLVKPIKTLFRNFENLLKFESINLNQFWVNFKDTDSDYKFLSQTIAKTT